MPITVIFKGRVPVALYLSQGALTTWAFVALAHWVIGSPEPSFQMTSLLALTASWLEFAGIRAVQRQVRAVNLMGATMIEGYWEDYDE